MKTAQNRFTRFTGAFFRSVFSIAMLYLLFLLGRGGNNLIASFSLSLGFSSVTVSIISSLFIALFVFLGLLVLIHFFRPMGSD